MIKKHRIMICLFTALVFLCSFLLNGCSAFRLLGELTDAAIAEIENSAPTATPEPLPSAPEPSVSANPQEDAEEEERRLTSFDDMEYERPDATETIRRIEEINSSIAASEDFEALEALLEEAVDLYYHFLSMGTLASIHSYMDLSDDYWLEEEKHISQNYAGVQLSFQKLYHTLFDSSFKTQIEEEWGEDYFDAIDDMEYVNEETKPLYEEEALLTSKYIEKVTTAAVDYNGEQLTYSDIMSLADYDELKSALLAWYDVYNPELGQLYIDLVKVRQKIAQALGYDSYTDLSFDGDYPDYTPEMAERYLDDIVKYAVPVFQQLAYDGLVYSPSVSMEYEEFSGFLRDVLHNLSPDLLETYDVMEHYGLIDYEPRSFKESGAQTTYIYDYDAPFILMNYEDDASSMSTLVHEYGHFNEYYLTRNELAASLDTVEIFSQALELLVANHYSSSVGDEAGYQMLYDIVSDTFTSYVEQPYYTAMELQVYSLDPDTLTVDMLNEIARQESARFGLDIFWFDEFHLYDWVTLVHIYEYPFYTLSYSTSADVSLQIWEASLQDEAQAVDIYFDLLYREESDKFIENVEAAGLTSPFETGRAQEVADFAQRMLVNEDWPGWQDAA
ncbi:hypothetical protein LJC56_03105 [Christensenellaceae bacterium OttesenSCG-928-K19]|nr:hypothetical protein [Christensenellaceae bacterium OttesenSCG-928-K19]